MKATICVLPGDGIGPEVTSKAVAVLSKVASKFGHDFTFNEALMGGIAIDKTGTSLPAESLKTAEQSDVSRQQSNPMQFCSGQSVDPSGQTPLPVSVQNRVYCKSVNTLTFLPICVQSRPTRRWHNTPRCALICWTMSTCCSSVS